MFAVLKMDETRDGVFTCVRGRQHPANRRALGENPRSPQRKAAKRGDEACTRRSAASKGAHTAGGTESARGIFSRRRGLRGQQSAAAGHLQKA
eukprot:g11102.t1